MEERAAIVLHLHSAPGKGGQRLPTERGILPHYSCFCWAKEVFSTRFGKDCHRRQYQPLTWIPGPTLRMTLEIQKVIPATGQDHVTKWDPIHMEITRK